MSLLTESVKKILIKHTLRATFKLPSRLPLPISWLRGGMEYGSRLLPQRQDVTVESCQLGAVAAEKVSVQPCAPQAILHLHGGAFIVGSARTHRGLAAELAIRTGADVFLPNYRLAPQHRYPAPLEDALSAWHGLLAAGYQPAQIILGGDSAGASLLLSLVVALRDQGADLPAALYVLSPYVDSALQAPSIARKAQRDPMLARQVLQRGSSAYGGTMALNDARISPLFADLSALPPLLIQVGSEEILYDDAVRLETAYAKAGNRVICEHYEGMWHDFQLFGALLADARRALDQVATFVRQRGRPPYQHQP